MSANNQVLKKKRERIQLNKWVKWGSQAVRITANNSKSQLCIGWRKGQLKNKTKPTTLESYINPLNTQSKLFKEAEAPGC